MTSLTKIFTYKKILILFFVGLAVTSATSLGNLKFNFDFSQFFPKGDEDIIFYEDFIKDFGTDDNFLLIGVENGKTVFEKEFLTNFHEFSLAAKHLPGVKSAESLTTLSYPLKTSFGYTKLPIIHIQEPSKYVTDWKRLKGSELYMNSLIDKEATSMVVALITEDELDYDQSTALLEGVHELLGKHELSNAHIIGRASFYEAIVSMQKREFIFTSLISFILITVVLFVIYKDIRIVLISLSSVLVGILIFMGILAAMGRELNLLALFYPLLLVIVGTSDLIHVMDGFIREINAGAEKKLAIITTLKGVGVTTLLTSLTTAAGFTSLLFSKLEFIANFGINSALGVMIMYVTVIFFACSLLLSFNMKKVTRRSFKSKKWELNLLRVNAFTRNRPRLILTMSGVLIIFFAIGVGLINTNYQFKESLPQGSKIAEDFDFFQNNYSGFRPLEVAITTTGENQITDYDVAKEIEKVSGKMLGSRYIKSLRSINLLHKSMNKANNLNQESFFKIPETKAVFENNRRDSEKLLGRRIMAYMDSTKTKGRITAKVLDKGSDSLLNFYSEMNQFFADEIDSSIVNFRLTGKGLLLDKNSVYIRTNLLEGLLFALLLVSILMVLLFRNIKLVLISLVPNIMPLLFTGAVLGYLEIPLEATISIVFAIAFGIAVDDTIHFLAKYRQCELKGLGKEDALSKTFIETGRPLVITTIILFFGFLVLLFSVHNPSVIIGLMIGSTLVTALVFDLLLIPVLIRKLL